MTLTFLKQTTQPRFRSPNPPQCYLASGKSACHGKVEQLAKIFRRLDMKPIPEKLRWIPVKLQAGIYLLRILTGKPWDISEHHHPGASPQRPPPIVFPHSPQTSWESSRERAGSALQSCSRISPWGQSCEHGQLAVLHGDQHAAPPRAGTSGRRCRLLLLRSPVSLGHLYNIFNIQQLFCCCLRWNNLGRKRQLNPGIIFYTVRNAKITSLDE